MKIRSDFVTNSSSSSFIVGFKNKQEYEEVKSSLYKKLDLDDFERIFKDIDFGKITYTELCKKYRSMVAWNVRFDMQYTREYPYYNKEYSWFSSKEFEKLYTEELDRVVENFISKLKPRGIYAILEYGDDCGEGKLEHHIAPYLSCTLQTISHH